MYIIIFMVVLIIIIIIVIIVAVSSGSSSGGSSDSSNSSNTTTTSNKKYYPGLQWICYPTYYNENFANLNVLMSSANYNEWVAKSGAGLLNPNVYSGNTYSFDTLETSTTSTNSSGVYAFGNNLKQQYYSIVWYGYFKPNRTGDWSIYIESDDGSYVWVNTDTIAPITNFDSFDPTNLSSCGIVIGSTGNAQVKNGGLHSKKFIKTINLPFTANKYYPIVILYGQNDKESTFRFGMDDPKGNNYQNNLSNLCFNKISN